MIAILVDTNAYTAFKQGFPDAVAVVQRASHLLISVGEDYSPVRDHLTGRTGGSRGRPCPANHAK